jgi:hypothetical protein
MWLGQSVSVKKKAARMMRRYIGDLLGLMIVAMKPAIVHRRGGELKV